MRTSARQAVIGASAVALVGLLVGGGAAAQGAAPVTTDRGPAEVCVPATVPFDADEIHLTGLWSADNGAIYYVRQVGDKVWLTGMSDAAQRRGELGRDWTSSGMGTLDGSILTVEFADLPRGEVRDNGSLRVAVQADADGNLIAKAANNDGITTFTPCQPMVHEHPWFARPFSYSLPFGLASARWPGSTDLQAFFTPDVPDSGASFWVLGPGLAVHCSAPGVPVPTDWTPQSIVDYLRANPELEVGEPVETTISGLPGLTVDVSSTTDAAGCGGDGFVRMWKESGQESSVSTNGGAARLYLVEADGATFAIEVWGPDPETWRPIGQRIVDSISIDTTPLETIGQAAEDGARIVRVDEVDERTRDLTIESPSVGFARARLLLPDGWEAGSGQDWPTLYLLHGAWDDYTSWTRETDVADIPELRDVLVVMPDAGQFGWYSDWQNEGAGGQPAWETFHTQELPQLIEADWGGGQDRVVAGLSMGGFGALSYAARHPGMFKAAAAYSAVADTVGSDFEAEALMWGDKTDDVASWKEHNPVSKAAALEGTDLYISYGTGAPGPLDGASAQSDGLEAWLAPQNDALVARLEELGIPATVEAYGDGTHTWPYWERALHASLPVLLGGLQD